MTTTSKTVAITVNIAVTPGADAHSVALQVVEDLRTSFRFSRLAIDSVKIDVENREQSWALK